MSAVVKDIAPEFRPMSDADLPEVLRIERASYDFPWTLGIFNDCLRAGYCCWVSEVPAQIYGYGIMTIAAEECHILNFCIDPAVRRCGFGRALMEQLVDLSFNHGARLVYLEVRPSNRAAIDLYLSMGFGQAGVRRSYYPATDGREDALLLTKLLDPEPQ